MNQFLRSLMAVFAFLFVMAATAAPSNYEGLYKFNQQIDVATSKTQIVLRVGNDEGRKLLADFKADGYICKAEPNSIYSCSKIMALELTEASRGRLLEAYSGYSVDFRGAGGDFALVNDSEFLKEWEREQKVMVQGRPFYKVRHIEGSGFAKLKIYNEDAKQIEWFNVVQNDAGIEIRHPLFVTQRRASEQKNILNITETLLVELVLVAQHFLK